MQLEVCHLCQERELSRNRSRESVVGQPELCEADKTASEGSARDVVAREPDDLPRLFVLRPSACPMTSSIGHTKRLGELLREIVLNRTDYRPAPPLPLARRG